MKFLFIIWTILVLQNNILATEQVSDLLLFKGEKLFLSTGWGHPSPLETYYQENKIDYPFDMLSTANYRGHIATWVIDDNKFYLSKIDIEGKSYLPKEYSIKSKYDNNDSDNVLADWFSGILYCNSWIEGEKWENRKNYYFHIRNGILLDFEIITNQEYSYTFDKRKKKKLRPNQERLFNLNKNYITYYFRIGEDDHIKLFEENCRLEANSFRLSPIYQFFDNDHLKWKYSWENLEKSGAPNCSWEILDSVLYLKKIDLYSGLDFDSVTITNLSLETIFSQNISNNLVQAKWVSGVFLIKHGSEKPDKDFDDFIRFEIDKFTLIRVKKGKLIEKYSFPKEFDFEELPENLSIKEKLIITDYLKAT